MTDGITRRVEYPLNSVGYFSLLAEIGSKITHTLSMRPSLVGKNSDGTYSLYYTENPDPDIFNKDYILYCVKYSAGKDNIYKGYLRGNTSSIQSEHNIEATGVYINTTEEIVTLYYRDQGASLEVDILLMTENITGETYIDGALEKTTVYSKSI